MKIKALACIIAAMMTFCASAYATETQNAPPQPPENNTENVSPDALPPMPPMDGEAPAMPDNAQQGNAQPGGRNPWEGGKMQGAPGGNPWGGGMPFQQQTENTANENKVVTFLRENFTLLSSAVLLISGFLFVIFYKRKMY